MTIVINMTIIEKKVIGMKKRLFWLIISAAALFAGALLYGLCRPDTYIGSFLGAIVSLRISADVPLYGFLSWYFPDYLWMLSLTSALFAVYLPKGKGMMLLGGVSCAWGILWEVGQQLKVVTGTADLWDVCMYIMAVISAAMINILKRGN